MPRTSQTIQKKFLLKYIVIFYIWPTVLTECETLSILDGISEHVHYARRKSGMNATVDDLNICL